MIFTFTFTRGHWIHFNVYKHLDDTVALQTWISLREFGVRFKLLFGRFYLGSVHTDGEKRGSEMCAVSQCKQVIQTRMYSSRMRTACSLPYGVFPLDRPPPPDRDSLDRDHLDRDPPRQRPPLDKDPLDRDPPKTETPQQTPPPSLWTNITFHAEFRSV